MSEEFSTYRPDKPSDHIRDGSVTPVETLQPDILRGFICYVAPPTAIKVIPRFIDGPFLNPPADYTVNPFKHMREGLMIAGFIGVVLSLLLFSNNILSMLLMVPTLSLITLVPTLLLYTVSDMVQTEYRIYWSRLEYQTVEENREIEYNEIEDVDVSRNRLQETLDIGDVLIYLKNGDYIVLEQIRDHKKHANTILEFMENTEPRF